MNLIPRGAIVAAGRRLPTLGERRDHACSDWLTPGAAKPQRNSGVLGVPRTCRDGPPGRLYGALHSSVFLAEKKRIFALVARDPQERLSYRRIPMNERRGLR